MLRKKLVLLGSPGVGKTSLVNRWVRGIFSEKYLQTIGVRIEKKRLELGNNLEVTLMIWDIAGDRELKRCAVAYLRGADGCLFVVDGTQEKTFDDALQLLKQVEKSLGKVPFAFALNKKDQEELWKISTHKLSQLSDLGILIFKTSAKNGTGVDEVFKQLALQMIQQEINKSA